MSVPQRRLEKEGNRSVPLAEINQTRDRTGQDLVPAVIYLCRCKAMTECAIEFRRARDNGMGRLPQ